MHSNYLETTTCWQYVFDIIIYRILYSHYEVWKYHIKYGYLLLEINEWCQREIRGIDEISCFDPPIKRLILVRDQFETHLLVRLSFVDKLNTRSLRNKNVALSCLFTCSLRTLWMTRDWNGEFDLPADALSTPSSFHCCLSQVPYTCRCLFPHLVCCARVVLECSAIESRKERAGLFDRSLFRFS